MSDPTPSGVLDPGYADRRRYSKPLVYRYRVRARVAVDALLARRGELESPRVLDLGAAEGRTLLEVRTLLEGRGEYVGVEYSQSLVEAAAGLPANVRVQQGDVTALPPGLEAGQFDLCTALAVLEHLVDPGKAIAQAYRMLAPGGILVATCPNPFWDEIAGRLGLIHDDGGHHEHELRIEDIEALFRDAGFEGLSAEGFMWAPVGSLPYVGLAIDPGLSMRVDSLARRLPGLRHGFVNQVVVGQKPGQTS